MKNAEKIFRVQKNSYLGRFTCSKKRLGVSVRYNSLLQYIFEKGKYFGLLAYQETNKWYTSGVQLVKNNLQLEPNKKTAKNTILFMGDGMGITTITAARILDGQKRSESGEENLLGWEGFPWSAQSKTYNVNSQSADSGACATAYLCGVKTNQGK